MKVSKIVGLADDIKLSLAAADIRIGGSDSRKSAVESKYRIKREYSGLFKGYPGI